MNFLTSAWKAVSTSTIANCFRKAGLQTSTTNEDEDLNLQIVDDDNWLLICDGVKVHDLNFKEYVTIDDNAATSEFREVNDIILGNKVGSDDDSDLDDTSTMVENEVPSRNEALEAINLLHWYMAAAPRASSHVSADVNRLENFIFCNSISIARQIQITEFTWPVTFFFFLFSKTFFNVNPLLVRISPGPLNCTITKFYCTWNSEIMKDNVIVVGNFQKKSKIDCFKILKQKVISTEIFCWGSLMLISWISFLAFGISHFHLGRG